jgi:ankyrin repeat protein
MQVLLCLPDMQLRQSTAPLLQLWKGCSGSIEGFEDVVASRFSPLHAVCRGGCNNGEMVLTCVNELLSLRSLNSAYSTGEDNCGIICDSVTYALASGLDERYIHLVLTRLFLDPTIYSCRAKKHGSYERTYLHFLVLLSHSKPHAPAIAQFLIAIGISPTHQDKNGATPLHIALQAPATSGARLCALMCPLNEPKCERISD